MNWIEVIATVAGAFGGLELLKWLLTRKQSARMAESKADSDEFHYLKERIEFADKQLFDKEQRFVEQTNLVRDLNRQMLELNTQLLDKQVEIGNLQSEVSELRAERKMKLCERRGCEKRLPKSGY